MLDPLHREDAADLEFVTNNKKIAQMLKTIPYPYSVADAENLIAGSTLEPDSVRLAARRAATRQLIGVVAIRRNGEKTINSAIGSARRSGTTDTQQKRREHW